MLNLTKPKTAKPVVASVPTYLDVMADVSSREARGEITASVAESYRSALRSCARRQNMPLEMCVADLERFDAAFPEDGFDPTKNGSARGYRLMRTRARGSIAAFLADRDGHPRCAVEVEDGWSELLRKLTPLTKGHPTRWCLAPQKLIPITSLAKACRAIGIQPRQLDRGAMEVLETHYQGSRRESHRGAAKVLDALRDNPDIRPLLPARPIAFERESYQPVREALPQAFEEEFGAWITAATAGDWDKVAEEFADPRDKHAHVAFSAFRTYLLAALDLGLLANDDLSCLRAFADGVAPKVIGALLARDAAPSSSGHLKASSTRKYLKVIRQVLDVAGYSSDDLSQALKVNAVLKAAAKAEKEMTEKNKAFCLNLIRSKPLVRRFLTAHQPLRRAAEELLTQAEDGKLTPRQRSKVYVLGASAAFAALEIAGAPLRIDNVLQALLVGQDAWIKAPEKGKGPIHVFVPRQHTKAKREDVRFSIKPDGFAGHETLLWYLRRIRPLIPGATSNPYFLPSPKVPGQPMSDKWFGAKFKEVMREVVNFPLNPHQFRHGQTSLLLNKHPEEVLVVSRRIGDRVDSMLRFYAFIDAVRAMERGQDLIAGLIGD